MRTRILLPVIGALAPLVVVSSALGATWDFDRDSGYGGSGHTEGIMTFNSASKLTYSGMTRDICPADGVGTSYYLLIDKTGTALYGFTSYKALDTSGCSDGQNGGGGGVFETSGSTKIAQARAVLCWTNDGNPCWQVAEPGAWKDNPQHP